MASTPAPFPAERAAPTASQPTRLAGGSTCAAAPSAATSAAVTRPRNSTPPLTPPPPATPSSAASSQVKSGFWDYTEEVMYDGGPTLAAPQHHPLDQPAPGPAGRVPTNWPTHLNS